MPASEPIPRRKLSDEVFDRLKRMITGGDVRAGDLMPSERQLMERFGVGRPAIREAMQALSNLGLLTISHGERARVTALTARAVTQQVDAAAQIMLATSPDSLGHLKEARLFFERGMVRDAALKATAPDLERLKALIALQRASLGDAERFIAADMEFHVVIAGLSGNPIFTAVSEAMLGWLKRFHTDLLIWTGKETLTLAEHEEIVGRIEARDPDGADAAMAYHLRRSAALYAHPTVVADVPPKAKRGRSPRPSRRSDTPPPPGPAS
ncbi:transcriptional regulator NanR [Lichenihabitans sp. Uapishka_5]|uniref:transcriptional regulator NanR n=1 Tax=Lichenihabitans sp. Uapishka_5 TaxID=3037302 RepID=UPI0029E7E56C|nr:transcriptional regulator NanR [Lichenihabitans sp. Uapishka_5]MDX7952376.1 transcriptional regulator NanR [Lichenihabitans sp. Uapishka_5]